MMKSPVYPRYDGGDYAFDPQVDFSQFLEEAKRNAREERYDEAHPQQQHQNMKSQSDEAKRSKKKSWKRSFLSWWKNDKKSSNSGKEQPPPKQRRGGGGGRLSSSGPLYAAGGGGAVISCKPRGPASGPLANLFLRQGKSVADEMPYMCLEKVDDPPSVPSYGPVYLVT